jgi:large subunit ribosomal protein L25
MELKLKAERRDETGKGSARKIRASGGVPGVVYGHGEPVKIVVDARELYHLLHTKSGMNVMVDVKVDGDEWLAMPREVQRDFLKDRLIHVDFIRINRDEKITVEVPIQLVGDSHGVREGGAVEHHLWDLQIESLPGDVPTSIEADITELRIGDSLNVSDLTIPPACTVLTSAEEIVVSVVTPQILKVEEAEPEAAEGVEGAEVEGEVEGEAAPDGEGSSESGDSDGGGKEGS